MSHTLVIFGASGDLTSRKLIPALYGLFRKKRLPEGTRIVGFARSSFSHDQWRAKLTDSTKEFAGSEFDAGSWQQFAQSIFYHAGDIGHRDDFVGLKKLLDELEQGAESTRVYYLATAPQFYEPAAEQLGATGLADESRGTRRIVIEKPFGTDLATAQRLNAAVHKVFSERQVYRIDHYLGKGTVQNVLVLRFANTIFEPIWNRNYIDHVQITVAEEEGVGSRVGYYEGVGALRDMVQNHLLQV
ncbi:MAG TPA: glucose-6-phosphate dehydrogenase, partial [Pirellulales bacterium]|nr:glucose-6-phosphate dehydrogenase [Pirellulales bacterium]